MLSEIFLVLDAFAFIHFNNKRLSYKDVTEFELKLGYKDNLIYQKPLIVNMKKTPHLLVCGLSGQGKSKMVEYALKDKNVILINAFEDDFISLKCERIIGNDNILNFLKLILNDLPKRKPSRIPLYIAIDELLVLCIDKNITKCIQDLLAIGRHYNIFIIGISQVGTKESIKFKDLFNCRVCFRNVEESSYRAVLGATVENTKLYNQQFYLYSDDVYFGETYTF